MLVSAEAVLALIEMQIAPKYAMIAINKNKYFVDAS
jgi:hypothetical protein